MAGAQSAGYRVLRDGVYLLPNRIEFIEPLQAQSEDVTASGGSAQILELNARDARQEAEFRQLFDRTPEYEKLLLEMNRRPERRSGAWTERRCQRNLTRLERDYESIALAGFLPGAARDQAHDALEDLARAANAVLSPDEPHAAAGRIQRWTPRNIAAVLGPPVLGPGPIAWQVRG